MESFIKSIVIVGGGTAGWLTASILASRFSTRIKHDELTITLCESPNIPIIGVGEGTWPTMASTLRDIGVSETDFFRECEASYKQGSKFVEWDEEASGGFYYHPFEELRQGSNGSFAEYWLSQNSDESFARHFSLQEAICEENLAPKNITDPEYEAKSNYGYHLNAAKFSAFLQKHCTGKLGVKHILADVEDVLINTSGNIETVTLSGNRSLSGDLFIDCTGFKSLLLGKALNVPFNPVSDHLFADTALATQVTYSNKSNEIMSYTQSTAQSAGWIWDIGLPTRRGVGYVFSSKYASVEQAKSALLAYIKNTGGDTSDLNVREINFTSGYRDKFWHKNCVAVGLSAGFLEPLEASALVLVELSAMKIAEQLPRTNALMHLAESRFNKTFRYHWKRAVDFLKLHYVLSHRNTPFWQDNRNPESIPESLQELMQLWEHKVPDANDFEPIGELFNFMSYQFVLYGNKFITKTPFTADEHAVSFVKSYIEQNKKNRQQIVAMLPSNRELLEKIYKYGLSTI